MNQRTSKPREIESAKELLLDRLMTVHPNEVTGGGLGVPNDKRGWHIKINLYKELPQAEKKRLPTTFMGFDVVYDVTGWAVAQ